MINGRIILNVIIGAMIGIIIYNKMLRGKI